MAQVRDIVIIGGGHNGLVAAFYFARAGLKPLVLERRATVGGIAVTEEFHPGFRCSALAHVCEPLRADVARDLQLEKSGLEMIRPEAQVAAPAPDGRALVLFSDPARSAAEIARFSRRDAERFAELAGVLQKLRGIGERFMSTTPPDLNATNGKDLWSLLGLGRAVRGLGKRDMLRLLRWPPMPIADLATEWFESEPLQAIVAARGVFGTAQGPFAPSSSAVLLLRAMADPVPVGATAFPRGGMGALTQAIAQAATRAGAEIRTNAEVAQVIVKNGAANGVVLANGEEIAACAVVSNADPKRTLLGLVDPTHFDPDFVAKAQHYRASGTLAKVNLALSGLPTFPWAATPDLLRGRIHIGPTVEYLERASDASKYGEVSAQPHLEITIPSLSDASLAPQSCHVMSIWVQYAPYRLKSGDWAAQREALGDRVVRLLSAYAPDLPAFIVHRQVLTPLDLEQAYGLTGGHISHGELALDQLFVARPLVGWARYHTPLRGLYLCGSGTHPGIGLTGASGANAAREVLASLRR